MTSYRLFALEPLLLSLIFLSLIIVASCGSTRQLQTVALSPAAADAKDFPNGQVQFSATGTYSGSSTPVPLTSKDILWCYGGPASVANPTAGVCAGNVVQWATVDQNGMAQCNAQSQGIALILAGTVAGLSANPDGGQALKIFGSAQLTCP